MFVGILDTRQRGGKFTKAEVHRSSLRKIMGFYSTVKFFNSWSMDFRKVIWFPFSPLCVIAHDVVIFAALLCCPMYMSEYLILFYSFKDEL